MKSIPKKKRNRDLKIIINAFKNMLYESLQIKSIKHEKLYIFGWVVAVIFLAMGISTLRNGLNFISIYTLILSIVLVALLVYIGRKYGVQKLEEKEVKILGTMPSDSGEKEYLISIEGETRTVSKETYEELTGVKEMLEVSEMR